MNFYIVRNKKAPWGDYGNILFYGLLSDITDQIVIERTGPFLPSAYFIFDHIVVDDSTKHILETFDLKGVDYSLAQKKKIVNLDWKDWSFEEKIPYKPKSGEPEDFILKGKHDEILAKNLGEIWAITPVETARGLIDKSKKIPNEYNHISLDLGGWNGNDVFRTPQLGHIFCTENFKNIVENIPNSYLTFIPISSV